MNKNICEKTQKINKILLVGAKHVGKSSVGKCLAHTYKIPFVDGDVLTLKRAQDLHIVSPQNSLSDLYNTLGKKKFHNIELDVIKNFDMLEYVFAAGGGILENPAVWNVFYDAHVVLLDVPFTIVCDRIGISSKNNVKASALQLPSFLKNKVNPYMSFKKMFVRRQNIYKQHADVVLHVTNESIKKIVQDIVQQIQKI